MCSIRLEDLEEFYLYDLKEAYTEEELIIREEMKKFIKGKKG